jgi:hypothetical protein
LTFTLTLNVTDSEVTGELMGKDAICHLYAGSVSGDKISFQVAEPCLDKHGQSIGEMGIPLRSRNDRKVHVVKGLSEFTASVSNGKLTGQAWRSTWVANRKR